MGAPGRMTGHWAKVFWSDPLHRAHSGHSLCRQSRRSRVALRARTSSADGTTLVSPNAPRNFQASLGRQAPRSPPAAPNLSARGPLVVGARSKSCEGPRLDSCAKPTVDPTIEPPILRLRDEILSVEGHGPTPFSRAGAATPLESWRRSMPLRACARRWCLAPAATRHQLVTFPSRAASACAPPAQRRVLGRARVLR